MEGIDAPPPAPLVPLVPLVPPVPPALPVPLALTVLDPPCPPLDPELDVVAGTIGPPVRSSNDDVSKQLEGSPTATRRIPSRIHLFAGRRMILRRYLLGDHRVKWRERSW
ncbi:MAG: hypothetical protein ABIV93_31415 [Byssovorax sp.]